MKARIPKDFGGGTPGNMQGMIKQAQKMQEDITQKQEELNKMDFKVSAGGGAIDIVINGKKEVVSLSIKPEVVDPEDIEMLEDLIISAVNEGIRVVEAKTNDEMDKITNGLNVPGLV